MPVGVHLAVVDPGVGGVRRPLALRDGDGRLFVGPDNGLLVPAAERAGIVEAARAREPRVRARVDLAHLPRPRPLRAGGCPSRARRRRSRSSGRRSTRTHSSGSTCPCRRSSESWIVATMLYVDSFGNVALNLTREDLEQVGIVPGTRVELAARRGALLRRRDEDVRRRTAGGRDPLRGQLPQHVRRDLERERRVHAPRAGRSADADPRRGRNRLTRGGCGHPARRRRHASGYWSPPARCASVGPSERTSPARSLRPRRPLSLRAARDGGALAEGRRGVSVERMARAGLEPATPRFSAVCSTN